MTKEVIKSFQKLGTLVGHLPSLKEESRKEKTIERRVDQAIAGLFLDNKDFMERAHKCYKGSEPDKEKKIENSILVLKQIVIDSIENPEIGEEEVAKLLLEKSGEREFRKNIIDMFLRAADKISQEKIELVSDPMELEKKIKISLGFEKLVKKACKDEIKRIEEDERKEGNIKGQEKKGGAIEAGLDRKKAFEKKYGKEVVYSQYGTNKAEREYVKDGFTLWEFIPGKNSKEDEVLIQRGDDNPKERRKVEDFNLAIRNNGYRVNKKATKNLRYMIMKEKRKEESAKENPEIQTKKTKELPNKKEKIKSDVPAEIEAKYHLLETWISLEKKSPSFRVSFYDLETKKLKIEFKTTGTKKELTEEELDKLIQEGEYEILDLSKAAKIRRENFLSNDEAGDEAGELELADKLARERENDKEKFFERSSNPAEETLSLEKDPSNPGQYLENSQEKLTERLAKLLEENPGIEKELVRKTFNPETRENSYDKAEVKTKILMVLGEKSDATRKSYLKKDYDLDKSFGGLKRFFGRTFDGKLNFGNAEEELKEYKDNYEKSKTEYLKALLEFGESDANNKEDVEILLRDTQITEQFKWRNDQIDIRMREDKFYGFKQFLLGAVNRYRKIRNIPAEKISRWTGSKWVGAGAGILMVGGTLREMGVGGNIPWRIFSAAVSSVGYKQMAESWAEKRGRGKDEEEIGKLKEEVSEKGAERLLELLEEKNSALDKRIQDEKYYRNWRTIAASGAGFATIFGGSWAGGKLLEYFQGDGAELASKISQQNTDGKVETPNMEKGAETPSNYEMMKLNRGIHDMFNAGVAKMEGSNLFEKFEYWKEFREELIKKGLDDTRAFKTLEASWGEESYQKFLDSDFAGDKSSDMEKEIKTPETKEPIMNETETNKIGEIGKNNLPDLKGIKLAGASLGVLDVEKGSSVEGTLQNFLKSNADKFTEGERGWDPKKYSSPEEWAGKRAHLIAEEYAKEHPDLNINFVSEKTQLGINFDNPADIKLEFVNDEDNLPKKYGVSVERVEEVSKAPEIPETPKTSEAMKEGDIESRLSHQQIQELKVADHFEIKSGDYAEINGLNYNVAASDYYEHINPPDSGAEYSELDFEYYPEAAELIKFVEDSGYVPSDNETIKEAVRNAVAASGNEQMSGWGNTMNEEQALVYFENMIKGEVAEIRKILFNGNSRAWYDIQGTSVDNLNNEQVNIFKNSAKATGLGSEANPLRGETVESWTKRVIGKAYEQGRLDRMKGYIKRAV